MSRKTSIYLPESVEKIIVAFGGENSLSGSIATLIERYARITADATPELTEAEWCLFCDANNGCGVFLTMGGHDQAPSAWANVADSEPDGLSEKWGVSCRDLAAKLQAMPLVARIAAWDVAARFWASPKLNDLSARDLLLECGAKIADLCPDCHRPMHKFHNCEINPVAEPIKEK